ncbi:helix-turn-helix transcriptional regulator [Streptomyces stelliscabiei]|uniref:helix-turn-helix domain-containing protein n=1 Tax=Streptomyces stelliscabiei TaxID=146820 RepID=UPI002FF04C60
MSAARDDVQAFAASLTRLKERTDRSYGQLARRLNMNTSTLHRYCAGDTVPLDFAPVERFAVLCGATGEERLEIHRLWLSAMATRQRVRGAGADAAGAGAGAAGPEAGRRGAAEPGATASGTAASEVGAPTPEAGAPVEAAGLTEAAGGSVAAAGPSRAGGTGSAAGPSAAGGASEFVQPSAADGASGPVDASDSSALSDLSDPIEPPEPAEPSEAAEPPDSAQAADPGRSDTADAAGQTLQDQEGASPTPPDALCAPAPAPARRPWHRRRRTLVSGAVVAVLLVTLGGIAALPSGRPPADSAAPGGGPAPARTTSGAQRPSTAPTSPSPSPDGTKSPSGTASPTPGEPPSSPTKGGETGKARPPATGVPLTWTADSQVWNLGCGHDYVIAKPPKEVPPPPPPQDAGAWAATQGAVHGRNTIVDITVQGRKSAAVVLTALRVRVVGRTAPAAGNAYAMDQGCGGRVSPRYFDVDLDKNRPIARPVDGADLDIPLPAVRFPYSVSADDPEVLMVSAETETCDCQWYLELEWSSEGRTGTVRIDDGGRPFRTTAIKGLPRYTYATENHRWVPLTD